MPYLDPDLRLANDWRITDLGTIAVPFPFFTLGAWLFAFESRTAGCARQVVFFGGGFELSFKLVSIGKIPVKVPFPSASMPAYHIKHRHPFRLCDLHGASGSLSEVGVAAGSGRKVSVITAKRGPIECFRAERLSGNMGFGAGVSEVTGYWAQTALGC